MQFLSTDISFAKGTHPHYRIKDLGENDIVITITNGTSIYPNVNYFLKSPQDITNFKNEILQSYERFLKENSNG